MNTGDMDLQADIAKMLVADDVRGMDYGYGVEGAMIQTSLHSPNLTDRMVMKKTLLSGTPTVACGSATMRMKSGKGAGKGRKALPEPNWMAVMETGLKDCPVAWLNKAKRTICLKAIPDNRQEKVAYHNELMKLCGLSLRELLDAMKKKRAQAEEKSKKKAQPRETTRQGTDTTVE